MEPFTGLNAPQTVFCLFFAIFWGLVANAQLRWKAFDWPLAMAGRTDASTYGPSWSRIGRSLWYLTVVPALLFLVLVSIFAFVAKRPYDWHMLIQLAGAVLAAHAAFAPYRFWLAAMERAPGTFYYRTKDDSAPADHYAAQPWGARDLRLAPAWAPRNSCAAWLYVAVAIACGVLAVLLG